MKQGDTRNRVISSTAHKAALTSSEAYRGLVSAEIRCSTLSGRDAARSVGSMLQAALSSEGAQSAEWRAAMQRGGAYAALLVCKHLLLRRALVQSMEEVQQACPDALRVLHDTLMGEYKRNKEQLRARGCLPRL